MLKKNDLVVKNKKTGTTMKVKGSYNRTTDGELIYFGRNEITLKKTFWVASSCTIVNKA